MTLCADCENEVKRRINALTERIAAKFTDDDERDGFEATMAAVILYVVTERLPLEWEEGR